jgi:hypothetical protein
MDDLAFDVATMLHEAADALDAPPPADPESITQHIEMIDAVEQMLWRAYHALPRAVLEKQYEIAQPALVRLRKHFRASAIYRLPQGRG